MRPIFHLSLPVHDMAEAARFYEQLLGGTIGRREFGFTDILVFGAQLTLQNDPASVSVSMPRTRHFGATLDWASWEAIATRLGESAWVREPPSVSHAGEPIEQGKMMIADPSGNLVELKAYRHPSRVLGPLAED
jgi:extradiol dioxygenase family protein